MGANTVIFAYEMMRQTHDLFTKVWIHLIVSNIVNIVIIIYYFTFTFTFTNILFYFILFKIFIDLLQGGRIVFSSGGLEHLMDEVKQVRPTVFAATPTFWIGLMKQFEG